MARVAVQDIEAMARRALAAAGYADWAAHAFARSVAAAAQTEAADALGRLASACERAADGTVDPQAVPVLERPADALVAVDAANGLAAPAIEAGAGEMVPLVRRIGCATMIVRRGALAGLPRSHVEAFAAEGLIGAALSAVWGAAIALPGPGRRAAAVWDAASPEGAIGCLIGQALGAGDGEDLVLVAADPARAGQGDALSRIAAAAARRPSAAPADPAEVLIGGVEVPGDVLDRVARWIVPAPATR